jgi:hypothetical protein
MKHLLITTIAAAVLLLFVGVNEVNADPLTYKIQRGVVSIVRCDTNATGELVIPSIYQGNPVTSIGHGAFMDCSKLTSVIIPSGVSIIKAWAFGACISLTSVTIPDSVTSIEYNAFDYCKSLASVTIPNSVISIESGTFRACSNLVNATIGDSVDTIGDLAFRGCRSLTSVSIGNSVTSIGDSAFRGCSSLTSVTIPDSVISIGDSAFSSCSNLTSVSIGNGVTSIGDSAFQDCSSLTSVAIPDSVISIGDYAFYSCSGLTGITIPDSVTNIGKGAFKGCGGLTNVTIPGSVTTIGEQPFSRCESLTSINVASTNTFYSSVEGVLFDKNKTLLIQFPAGKSGHYTIPNSVQSIGFAAFYGCKNLAGIKVPKSNIKYTSEDGVLFDKNKTLLISYPATKNGYYTIPDTVINIEYGAFYSASLLTSVRIPESVTSIGNYAFFDCGSLTSVTIPNSVDSIGVGAFSYCTSLTSVTIPNSIEMLQAFTFRGCSSLTSVTIPDSVDYINNGVFEGCTSLKIITFAGDAPRSFFDDAFNGVSENAQVNIKPDATGFGESIAELPVVIVTTPEVLTITETPSVVLSQRLKLEVWVTGAAPFQYQWNKDGRPIPGAVSNVFIIERAKPSDAGVYSVLVINEYGATVSDEVKVSVIPPKITLESRINEKGKFELKAIGPNNSNVTFQYSDNLKTWTDHLTLPLSQGSTTFSFPVPSNEEGQLFYRLKLVD